MVIENNCVHAAFAKRGNGFNGGRTAVHREQQVRRKFLQAIFHAVGAQAVAFVHPVRQIKIHLPAERAQDFKQQCGGSHAVHVIIAKDDERFIVLAGAEQSPDGGVHVRQQKRVGQIFEAGLEKIFNGGRFAEAAIEQALGQQRRNFEPQCQLTGKQRLRRRGRPAEFHFVSRRMNTDKHG